MKHCTHDQLQPEDKFAICAYDHRQYWFAKSHKNAATTLDVQVYEGLPKFSDSEGGFTRRGKSQKYTHRKSGFGKSSRVDSPIF